MNLFDTKQSGMRRRLHEIVLAALPLVLICAVPAYAQAPPANDECATAHVLPGSAPFPPYTSSVDATNATLNAADPLLSCNSGDGTQTVWYSYTPDASGLVDINTLGSTDAAGGELDTAHGAYTGSCAALVEVACADTYLNDNMNIEVEAGTTYYIKVGQFAGGSDAGTVVVNVEEGVPPIPPQTLIIESRVNGTSEPLGTYVAGLAPDPNTLAAARYGKGLTMAREIPNYMNPASLSGPSGDASRSGAGSAGSRVAGHDNDRWQRKSKSKLLRVFEGGVNDDNWDVLGTLIAPPDTVGDVGKSHYVQMYNLLTEIFDKDGNSVLGPFPTSQVFNGMLASSNCAYLDDGDPVVIYDEETDRWLISQFMASFQWGLCIAISTSGDPTGSYNVYEYNFNSIGFPDYPKFGFATGSVNVMINLFNPFQGSALGTIDKAAMMAGEPATMVLFTGGEAATLAFGWVPGDNDGPRFDNTPPTFFTNLGGSGDTIYVAEIATDWDNPENSELDFVAAIPVTPWDSNLCDGPRGACIDQPGSGTTVGGDPRLSDSSQTIAYLEGITDRMMHRGQMRNVSKGHDKDHKDKKDKVDLTAILSHTVDVDGLGTAGVRWYELRNHKDRGWELKKENTYSPDGDHRWMGSIAMTASGDTCLGYSISGESTYPSIGVTGRKGDASHMNVKELVAYDGNSSAGVQRGVARWGDYSSMSIDPVDDSCWYTQEVPRPNQSIIPGTEAIDGGIPFGEYFGWGTQVIHYDVDGKKKHRK